MDVQDNALGSCYAALGFKSLPFAITPDTSLAFPGPQYVSAYQQLYYACMNGVMAVLSAEIGLGKTFVIRCLLRALPANVKVAYLLNPLLDPLALLRDIQAEFNAGEQPALEQASRLHHALVQRVLQGAAQGERFVIIVDEAHRLSAEALETLRLLSNLETEQVKLISLVLVGQPELERTLSMRAMRPLRERIGVWLRLQPMNRAECGAYVRHRIHRTHQDGSFAFTPAALWLLHWRTRGVPRRINLACERAVLLSSAQPETRRVTWPMVWEACGEFSRVWK
ncbi:ExeA family protein [Hydrogenophaga sp.]|uniref:ExeA family protein n=1 Tax=Hydrogenophaga sp. TaxID=1904254 RepID=UPI003F6A5DD8